MMLKLLKWLSDHHSNNELKKCKEENRKLRKRIKELEPPKPPIKKKKIDWKKLSEILRSQLPLAENARIYLVDQKYYLTTKKAMEQFLRKNKTDLMKYVGDYRDCDDYSARLLGAASIPGWSGLAFGEAFGDSHAFNLFIDVNKHCYLIEPQNDLILDPKKAGKIYKPIYYIRI